MDGWEVGRFTQENTVILLLINAKTARDVAKVFTRVPTDVGSRGALGVGAPL